MEMPHEIPNFRETSSCSLEADQISRERENSYISSKEQKKKKKKEEENSAKIKLPYIPSDASDYENLFSWNG